MRYAESLRYGKLIDAQACSSYRLYSEWNLVCPCCKEPVFFAQGFERSSHSRFAPKSGYRFEVPASAVSPSFRHFDGDKSSCDNYSSSVTRNDFVRVAAKHRQQRLDKWNSSFLNCIGYEKKMKGCFFSAIKLQIGGSNSDVKELVTVGAKSLLTFTFSSKSQILALAREDIAKIISCDVPPHLSPFASGFKDWVSSVDIDSHLATCGEAIDFLKTRAATRISMEIQDYTYYLMCMVGLGELTKVRKKSDLANLLILQVEELGRIICFNNWYE